MFDEFNRWLREEGIELGRREDIRKGGRARVLPDCWGYYRDDG